MNIFQTIERANYLVSADAVQALAETYLDSSQTMGRAHGTYFRILLARVQDAICGKVTLRTRGNGEPLSDEERAKHMEAFERINAELYAVVTRAVIPADLEHNAKLGTDEMNRLSIERNRRTNFARTSASALRKYIRTGGNVLKLSVQTCTKTAVINATPRAEGESPTEGGERKKVDTAAKRIVALVQDMAASDKEAAAEALQGALAQIAGMLLSLGVKATTKPQVALDEHRLLKTPMGTFWPALEHRPQ